MVYFEGTQDYGYEGRVNVIIGSKKDVEPRRVKLNNLTIYFYSDSLFSRQGFSWTFKKNKGEVANG